MKSNRLFFYIYRQRRTGHITRWEKSDGAPLVWGPLRQSGCISPSCSFFFFLVSTSVWTWAFALFSSYFITFFLGQQFFFGVYRKYDYRLLKVRFPIDENLKSLWFHFFLLSDEILRYSIGMKT
jgi:hypothetical protein